MCTDFCITVKTAVLKINLLMPRLIPYKLFTSRTEEMFLIEA